jgi:hypothetical protein
MKNRIKYQWLLLLLLVPTYVLPQVRKVQWYRSGDSLFVVGINDPKIGTFVKIAGIQNTITEAVSLAKSTSVDSLEWARKQWAQSQLDRKQTAGTYLVPSDTNGIHNAIAGKQASGTYLTPSDTNALRSGLNGKQPAGSYLVPSDTNALRSGLNDKAATSALASKLGVAGYSVGDTAAFTTTATRMAIYIPGCRENQIWDATPRKPHATLLPVAGDFLAASPKWDSLIVKRAVGTTSGLKINYFRIK